MNSAIEHCTGITEVMGSNLVEARFIFQACGHNCNDRGHLAATKARTCTHEGDCVRFTSPQRVPSRVATLKAFSAVEIYEP